MNPHYCVYNCCAPFAKDNYSGITLAFFENRKRLHRSSDTSPQKQTMDRAHAKMLKCGFYLYLFGPLVGFTVFQPTRLLLRRAEVRAMILLDSNLNTQGNVSRESSDGILLD